MSEELRAAGMAPYATAETWNRAYAKAAAEKGLPPRGPRGSAQNKERRRRALAVAQRAREIFWLMRAVGRDESS